MDSTISKFSPLSIQKTIKNAVKIDSSLEDINKNPMNNTERLCRGCMSPMLNRSFSMKNEALRELFRKCTYLKIEEDDVLSKYLCQSCYTNCNQWKKFQLLCEESQNKFYQIITEKSKDLLREKKTVEKNDSEKSKELEQDVEKNESDMDCVEESDEETTVLPSCKVTINTDPVPVPLKVRVKSMSSQNSSNSNIQPIKQPPKFVLMCNECKQIFVKLDVYENHYRTKHTKDPIDFILCSVCRAMFTTNDECLKHLISTHTVHIFPVNFKCDICDMEFYKRAPYVEHYKIHQQLTCKICKKEFTQYLHLDRHIRLMHTDPKYECEICKKKCKTTQELTLHKRKQHTNESVGCCEYCGKTFVCIHSLRKHVEYVHELKEAPATLPCHLCSYVGITKQRLQCHIRSHTVQRNLACEFCPLKFKKKSTYQNHRMTHTGEKRFHCNICNHGFIQSHALKTHMKVHEKV